MRGHTAHVVHDGRFAADAAREFDPDIVLLDIGLPGMDGYQVVRQFRAAPDLATLMIVATTGYGRLEDKLRCLAAGFDQHIAKPLDVEESKRSSRPADSLSRRELPPVPGRARRFCPGIERLIADRPVSVAARGYPHQQEFERRHQALGPVCLFVSAPFDRGEQHRLARHVALPFQHRHELPASRKVPPPSSVPAST